LNFEEYITWGTHIIGGGGIFGGGFGIVEIFKHIYMKYRKYFPQVLRIVAHAHSQVLCCNLVAKLGPT